MKLNDRSNYEYEFTEEEVDLNITVYVDDGCFGMDVILSWETNFKIYALEYDDIDVATEDIDRIARAIRQFNQQQ